MSFLRRLLGDFLSRLSLCPFVPTGLVKIITASEQRQKAPSEPKTHQLQLTFYKSLSLQMSLQFLSSLLRTVSVFCPFGRFTKVVNVIVSAVAVSKEVD